MTTTAPQVAGPAAGPQLSRPEFLLGSLFVLSGLAALVYQVLWVRLLSLSFGTSAFAVSTVLAVFFSGLALGSALFGRAADRARHPLRWFAGLELVIAAFGLASPWLLDGVGWLYLQLGLDAGTPLALRTAARLVFSFLALIVPTTCMGGTLPVLSRAVARDIRFIGRRVGWLYTLNTAGAVLGAALVTFYLLPEFGVQTSLRLAAACNVLTGVGGLLLARAAARDVPAAVGPEAAAPPPPPADPGLPSPVTLRRLYFVSGAAALALEVLYTRVFSIVLGDTVFVFGMIVVVFVLQLALGSYAATRRLPAAPQAVRALGWCYLQIAVSVLVTILLLDKLGAPLVVLSEAVRRGPLAGAPAWVGDNLVRFVLIYLILFYPVFQMGRTFPLMVRLVCRDPNTVGGSVGALYQWNTVGSIVGSLAAGFVLLPLVGSQKGLMLMAVLEGWIACRLWSRRPAAAAAVPLAAGVLLWLFLPAWNYGGMHREAFHNRERIAVDLASWLKGLYAPEVRYHSEGVNSTVLVFQSKEDVLTLSVGSKVQASNHPADHLTQVLLGALPPLLHPDPREVLVVGCGTGTTLGTIARFPVDRLDLVELSGNVLPATELFHPWNHRPFEDPRVTTFLEDGRNYLLTTPRRYDVIAVDSFDPFQFGTNNFFTREFFAMARGRLKPGGLLCMWLPINQLARDDLLIILKTMGVVFPYASLWDFGMEQTMLVAGDEPPAADLPRWRGLLSTEGVRASLGQFGLDHPAALLALFSVPRSAFRDVPESVPLNTDDRPVLEYASAKSLSERSTDGREWVQAQRPVALREVDDSVRLVGADAAARAEFAAAHEDVHQAIQAYLDIKRRNFAGLRRLLERPRNEVTERFVQFYVETMLEVSASAEIDAYLRLVEEARKRFPGSAEVARLHGRTLAQLGKPEEAREVLERAAAAAPRHIPLRLTLARLLEHQGRTADALAHYEAILAVRPDHHLALAARLNLKQN